MNTVTQSVITLFILMFVGIALGKTKVINKEATPEYSNLVLKVTLPATVFLSIIGQTSDNLLGDFGNILVIAILVHAIGGLVGLIMIKFIPMDDRDKGVWIYTCMLSNNGFMGLPLALSVYGTHGMFLMACTNIVTNLVIFSIGVKLLTNHYDVEEKISIKKMFVNPVNVAVVLGFVFQMCKIPMHEIITDSIGYVGAITSGLSMLVVGFSLSRMPIKGVFADAKMFILAIGKLLIVPLLTIGLLKLLPISSDPVIIAVSVMSAALPASSAQSIIAEQYGTNITAAGRAVFITTLFSVVSVPLIMMLSV